MAVSSLFDSALQAVMRELPHHESGIPYLPGPVKGKIARVMARRGLLCDRNIMAVLNDSITELDLSECYVSPYTLASVSRMCPRLRRLNLGSVQGCRSNINSRVFCHLFSHCKSLQVLNLKCCSLIDDVAILTLVQHCSLLASLCLSGCYTISDKSVVAVAQRCKYLQALDLSRTKVSSDGLLALAKGCSAKVLKELKVSNCLNVCDSGVQAISLNCPRLSILVCHGCPLLTSNSREAIVGIGEGDGKGQARRGLKQITWTVY